MDRNLLMENIVGCGSFVSKILNSLKQMYFFSIFEDTVMTLKLLHLPAIITLSSKDQ